MAVFYDQLNKRVELPSVPKRIISVVPSQTELLFYLGLDVEVIGITKFCIHPTDKFKTTTKVGGTKQLNIQQIKELKPDLIIANKEENDKSQIEELIHIYPVWISDISNLDEALDMIIKVGELVDRNDKSERLVKDIVQQFNQFTTPKLNLSVAYFIWRKPYMVAGKQTYIDNLLERCGLVTVSKDDRYPEVTEQMLIDANPDVILLSSEPYPFTQKHIEEFQLLLPDAKVILVDGEMFSWYGSRLLQVPTYFKQLIETITAKQ
ncbi:MAG: Substrate-binding protein [Mucilaginibacter sp.]|uniref:helical backbone metal receptor n=1 Tax=Mucilaginibacter sp. TaxID=1882438 RepID=UPI002607B08F|nr:helical backbone metal receptor [Mucilaginibacter sp.]MDB5003860.1 Substrate-binding protein [Mucilaginibacter sp.]